MISRPLVNEVDEVEGEVEGNDKVDAEPIIELPESPSPPADINEHENGDNQLDKGAQATRAEGAGVSVQLGNGGGGDCGNGGRNISPLGVQPRKPIRTHQASPLATMTRPGHSMKRWDLIICSTFINKPCHG